MRKLKVSILYNFKNRPWGGGNQFLKALRGYLVQNNVYTDNAYGSDIILFNSHHQLSKTILLKRKTNAIFVHRVDGPIFTIRNKDAGLDKIIFRTNFTLADATIFQSNWSRHKCFELGLFPNHFENTIPNAPDPTLFNRQKKRPFSKDRKIRLIATSWSNNWRKGFGVYKWLDKYLDFARYEMIFVGNSLVNFENIRYIKPLPMHQLSVELKKSDIFIIASQKDPCSNSLIEALHCGLPAIALNDGGHPEIIGKAGKVFDRPDEIPELLDKIVESYQYYQESIQSPTIEDVGKAYYDFMSSIFQAVQNEQYAQKDVSLLDYLRIWISIAVWKPSLLLSAIR